MKRALVPVLAAALCLATGNALARDRHVHVHDSCDVHSEYALQMHGKAFVFTRDDGPAQHVAIGGGRLFVDGKEVALDAADRERVQRFEAGLNRLVPQMQAVVVDATDIAFSALEEVARGFAPKGGSDVVARLEESRAKLHAELRDRPVMMFNDDLEARVIKPVVTEYVPLIAGNAVSSTLAVVFSGDEKKAEEFGRRMDAMGDEIERKVEKRAKSLEPRVDALCDGARDLDRLEDGLALRLEGGQALDLLRTTD